MPSDVAKRMFPNLKIDESIKEDIIKDKKVYKPLKDDIKVGGKKRGRPPKAPGTKLEKLNLHIEPKYKKILEEEARERGLAVGPYIVSEYIIKPLKERYEKPLKTKKKDL
jgi:hypothetical protein